MSFQSLSRKLRSTRVSSPGKWIENPCPRSMATHSALLFSATSVLARSNVSSAIMGRCAKEKSLFTTAISLGLQRLRSLARVR